MFNRLALAGAFCLAGVAAAVAQTPAPTAPARPAAPSAPAPAPLAAAKTMLSVKDLMKYVTNPAAETFWKAGGEVETEEGVQSRTPETEARWIEAANAAAVLLESGNLLMMQGRARGDKEWMQYSQQLADAGAAGLKAAQAKDGEATFAAGSEAYDSCFKCHGRYIPRPKNSLWNQP